MTQVHDRIPLDELAIDYVEDVIKGRLDMAWRTKQRMLGRCGSHGTQTCIDHAVQTLKILGLVPEGLTKTHFRWTMGFKSETIEELALEYVQLADDPANFTFGAMNIEARLEADRLMDLILNQKPPEAVTVIWFDEHIKQAREILKILKILGLLP